MDYTNLYRTLVVGGAMLTGACATSSKQAPASDPSAPSDASEAEAAEGSDESPGTETSGTETLETKQGELACDEICDGDKGRGRVCPDPNVGGDNCCWLMMNPHPCCEE